MVIVDNRCMSGDPGHPQGPFRAYAHRGGAQEKPENSPAAFAHAVSLGYTWLETDVRPTSDGVALLHHDARFERTTDAHGLVREFSWNEAQRVHLADGTAPMRLEDLLSAYPYVSVNIDLKESGSVSAVADAVTRCRAWSRVCLTSFSRRRMGQLRRRTPSWVETSAVPSEVAALRFAATLDRPVPRAAMAQRGPRRLQIPLHVGSRPLLTERLLAWAHRRGLAVDAWTIDEADEMHRLLDLGVDGIMTDRPLLLREVLHSRGRWP